MHALTTAHRNLYDAQGRLDLCIVYGAAGEVLNQAPGGRVNAKMVPKSAFTTLSLMQLDGYFYLRPDRILACMVVKGSELVEHGIGSSVMQAIATERRNDAETQDRIGDMLAQGEENHATSVRLQAPIVALRREYSMATSAQSDDFDVVASIGVAPQWEGQTGQQGRRRTSSAFSRRASGGSAFGRVSEAVRSAVQSVTLAVGVNTGASPSSTGNAYRSSRGEVTAAARAGDMNASTTNGIGGGDSDANDQDDGTGVPWSL